jgi:chromosome condensin MukBEF ATPase and DNA-binding subunit MukB
MVNPFLRMTGVLVTAGLTGMTFAPLSVVSAAQFTPAPSFKVAYNYSPQLASRYTSGCSDKLRNKGKSAAQAQQICQCSLRNMQAQHSQGQAIGILMRAQFSGSYDSRTGLPTALSRYFSSCGV